MCHHYQAEKRRQLLEKRFGLVLPADWEPPPGGLHIYPTDLAPILRRPIERASGDDAVPEFELVEARFGLLPRFAEDVSYGKHTYNARSETVATKPSFKDAWAHARHCIVPCAAIYEPDWRSGKHVPTRFTPTDGGMFGVAGLWGPWKTPTGEWINTFTMLTVNADDHAVFKHMHRPDPARPPELQDKRMVVVIPDGLYEAWLDAPAANAAAFMRQYPADRFVATPEPVAPKPKTIKPPRRPKPEPPQQISLLSNGRSSNSSGGGSFFFTGVGASVSQVRFATITGFCSR
ncbi:SOS response-associated peptidase [Variovorax ginsengisoli]|uniref:Abasic site processing protein n=1 Tax=Variovorax ginsengisoli TaxID=363844 RepID=A0ABT9SF09_9BURK|nr:SOS response-associated peptidase [Variovorax ginsengisoli]MDP9902952.1 putative SOS response-associated peptidase YedK [Variovorax ginsengisoli]